MSVDGEVKVAFTTENNRPIKFQTAECFALATPDTVLKTAQTDKNGVATFTGLSDTVTYNFRLRLQRSSGALGGGSKDGAVKVIMLGATLDTWWGGSTLGELRNYQLRPAPIFLMDNDGAEGEIGQPGPTGARGAPGVVGPIGMDGSDGGSEITQWPWLDTGASLNWSGPHTHWGGVAQAPITINTGALSVGNPSLILQGGNNTERMRIASFGANPAPHYDGIGAGGTVAAPTRTLNGARIWGANMGGYDNAGTPAIHTAQASIRAFATEDWTATALGTQIQFFTTPATTTTLTNLFSLVGTGAQLAGYLNAAASIVAPSNTTAGDITGLRGHFGTDAAFSTLNGAAPVFVAAGAIQQRGTINTATASSVAFYQATSFTGAGDSPQGFIIQPTFNPSGSISNAFGLLGAAIFAPTTGITISNAINFYTIPVTGSGGGAITNLYGFYVNTVSLGSVVPTNLIGHYIVAQTGATNNYDMGFGTVDAGGLGNAAAYAHRIPVLINGVKEYLHTHTT